MPTAYQIEKIEELSGGELDDLIIKILSQGDKGQEVTGDRYVSPVDKSQYS